MLCNFITSNKANYSVHLKTKKHQKKVSRATEGPTISHSKNTVKPHLKSKKKSAKNGTKKDKSKLFQCDYCGENLSRRDSLRRHQRSCAKKRIQEISADSKLKEMELKLEYERELRQMEIKQTKIYKAEAGYYRDIFNDTKDMMKTTVNAFRLLSEAIANPKALQSPCLDDLRMLYDKMTKNKTIQAIEDAQGLIEEVTDEIEDSCSESVDDSENDSDEITSDSDEVEEEEEHKPIRKKDDDFIEDLFQQHSDGTIHEYIGNMIIVLYKKDDHKDQVIFNSDPNRLTYIISKVLYEDGEVKWHIDKGGIDTKKIIIKPILDGLRPILFEYYVRKCKYGDERDNGRRLRIEERVLTMIKEIDNEKLHNKIIKYIANSFYMDRETKKAIKDRVKAPRKKRTRKKIKNA